MGNPFSKRRTTLIDPSSPDVSDWIAQVPVADLTQIAINNVVESATAAGGLVMFGELDRRGRAAWREVCLLLLDFISVNPVGGAHGAAAVAALRKAIPTAPDWQRLVLTLWAEHREGGVEAAGSVWDAAEADEAIAATRRLFTMALATAVSAGQSLSPAHMQAISRELAGA